MQIFKAMGKNKNKWKLHDIYAEGNCYDRVVTRSQVAFIQIKNTKSDLKLLADNRKHQPPGMPHLMTTLKGEYGAVPKTIISRRFAQYVPVSEALCTAVNKYKTAIVTDVKTKEKIKEYKVEKEETEVKVGKERKKDTEKQETKVQVNNIKGKEKIVPKQYKEENDKPSGYIGNILGTVSELVLTPVSVVNELFRRLLYNQLPYFGQSTVNDKNEDTEDKKEA